MPFISKIEARAYARATEIPERVEAAVTRIFPEELRPGVSIEKTSVEGQAGDTISVIRGSLENKEHCETTFDFILREIKTEDRRALERSTDIRIDENCVFFMRIDKQVAYLGNLTMNNEVDVVSIRIHFRDYPRCKREDAIQMIEHHIQNAGEREVED